MGCRLRTLSGLAVALAVATAGSVSVPAPARADFFVVPPNRTATKIILYSRALNGFRKAVESVQKAYASKASLSTEIAQARTEFWSRVGEPDGYEERYAEYLRLLLAKDYVYMAAGFPEGPNSQRGQIFARFGGDVDGGIPKEASVAFDGWISAIRQLHRRVEGQLLVLSPSQLLDTLANPEVVAAYRRYQTLRDRAEYDRAGYLAYFDARAADAIPEENARQDVVVTLLKGSDPEDKRRWYRYTQVPEMFVPDVTADMAYS
ncbi:hypothetical protein MWN33_02590 [Starkeya koreensis]|uniref:DUF4919 domain-containing protein n=1 Tax=Ancylobacter koreensis TaxID=266121 RepID=A0ABT0DI05_9HYPH|nr:hypothetical protein [Ancylobacter koreensis]MCK0206915.1 hypothetical protein [Ancylobacter koreensis]